MKKKILFFSSIILLVCSCYAIFSLRVVPFSKAWKGYQVVYFEKEYDIDKVLTLFSDNKIENVISLAHKPFPSLPKMTPVLPPLVFGNNFAYSDFQNAFFYDKSGSFLLFYIPDMYTLEIQKVIDTLSPEVNCGLVTGSSYPLLPPILSAVFFILLILRSKKRGFVLLLQLPFVFISFCYPIPLLSVLSLFTGSLIYIVQDIFYRDLFIQKIKKNLFAYIVLLYFLIVFFIEIKQVGLLLAIALIQSCCFYYMYRYIRKKQFAKSCFTPVLIKNAMQIKTEKFFNYKFVLFPTILVLLLVLNQISPKILSVSDSKEILSIPSPKNYSERVHFTSEDYVSIIDVEDKTLPDLSDLINANWFIEYFPYRKLSEFSVPTAVFGDSVFISDYEKKGKEVILKNTQVSEFNFSYISDTIATIYNIDCNGPEKLLVSQNQFTLVDYSTKNGTKMYTKSMIFLVVFGFITYLLVLLLLLIKGKGK